MNWRILRHAAWLDNRAHFVAGIPQGGALLDLGTSDGETLGHFGELRPDLRLRAVDLGNPPSPDRVRCEFHRADLEQDRLPWGDGSIDAITCMHLVEHLRRYDHLMREIARLLRPGGRLYLETPHPRTAFYSSASHEAAGTFTLNFYDDPTHVRPVSTGEMARWCREAGLVVMRTGISRNWLFAASWPWYWPRRSSRQKWTARSHWLGWSAFLTATK